MTPRWRALAILTAARTSLGVQFQSLASVSPTLLPDLRLSYGDLGFLIGLYFLPGLVMALPAGAIGRRFGDRRVVIAGLVLMVAGGVLTGLAPDATTLVVGRALSGIGAVLLNVLMSKMVTDWFAGREIVLAMAIFVNSFPIGVGLALLTLGWLATVAGWSTALLASSAFALAALALTWRAYEPHPNDHASPAGPRAAGAGLGAAQALLVCGAGAIWGIFNGAFAVTSGFAPAFVVAAGLSVAQAGVMVGATTALAVVSIQVGGLIAQRWGRPSTLMVVGLTAWAACLAGLASGIGAPGPMLVVTGLLMGLPVGVIMSLPGQALRPEQRGLGMGLFYLWLYVGHASVPPVAGWLQDRTGSTAAPLWFAAALVVATLPIYAAVRAGIAAREVTMRRG
jgi:MFS family permease